MLKSYPTVNSEGNEGPVVTLDMSLVESVWIDDSAVTVVTMQSGDYWGVKVSYDAVVDAWRTSKREGRVRG